MWNRAVVLRIGLRAFFKNRFNVSTFETFLKIEILVVLKHEHHLFKNLSDKLSMSAILDGFKPFKILSIFSGDVTGSWKFKSFDTVFLLKNLWKTGGLITVFGVKY